jgi:D-threonate/D-erythronate kinase
VKRIAIIADDLTSACDGAAPFVAAGFRAHVGFDPPGRGPLVDGVTAVDTDSRSKSATEAARCAAAVTAALAGADVLFKTVDSTLRGHLVAEIDAALAVSGRRTAVLAPAFPAQGRTTVAGVQHLDGQPVDRTWFGQDPGHPVRCADLVRLFPGAMPFAGGVGAARYVVADARSDADLDRVVAGVPIEQVLWVGSPGLAAALARRLGPHAAGLGPEQGGAARRVLFVIGSLHPASREQLGWLCSAGGAEAISVLDDGAVERAEQRLARQRVVVLHGPTGRAAGQGQAGRGQPGQGQAGRGQPGQGQGQAGQGQVGQGQAVLAMLAEVTARLAGARAFDALVITGGETARTVLLGCGVRGLELGGELEPGIPLGFADHPLGFADRSLGLPVVVKAGGFGDPRLLARLHDLMTTTSDRRPTCGR